MIAPDRRGVRQAAPPPDVDGDLPRRVDVLGVGVSCLTLETTVATVERWVERDERHYVCVTGVHGVMEARRDPELRDIHNRSGLTTPDGMPMVWCAHRAGRPDVSRVYGPDLMLAVLERARTLGWPSFFYGGGPGTAELLARRVTDRLPGLIVAGTYTPPFRPLTREEDEEIVQRINDSGARLVWVGLSTPTQERWMAAHTGMLTANVLFGVGAAFDIHAGTLPQAPGWMQRSGLEWAYRLGREPRRLWRRYLRNNPAFVLGVLRAPPRILEAAAPVATATPPGTRHRPRRTVGPFAVGDVVRVRPAEEILASLDERGELDALPFMPEMLAFCGQRFTVDKLASKACDTVTWSGLRRMEDAVHLAGVRCDGQAHGGCQAGCLLYWKTAWLTTAEAASDDATLGPPTSAGRTPERPGRAPAPPMVSGRYTCQATELTRAAPARIPPWQLRQYLEDVRSGNARAATVAGGLVIGAFNRAQSAAAARLPQRLLFRGGRHYPFIEGGRSASPPGVRLDLQPGEWVRVKTKGEIVATLDAGNRNRGLSFDAEMLKYCGRRARVLRRVEQIIDESSGSMIAMKNPCIILDDVVCTSDFHRSCPRGIYPYWREIWLERVAGEEDQ